MAETLADRVVARPATPGTSQQAVTLRADPTKEYAVGGYRYQTLALPHRLSPEVDDIAALYGADYYDCMARESVVSSCLHLIVSAVLESGVKLVPAVSRPLAGTASAQYDKACRIKDKCQAALDGMEEPLEVALYDLAWSALVGGYKVAENVWRVQDRPKQYDYTLHAVKPKDRYSLGIVVDVYNNVLGFHPLQAGKWVYNSGLYYLGKEQLDELVPRDKCSLLTFRKHNSDPRGQSALRAATVPYEKKKFVLSQHDKYVSIVATPTAIGTTAETETVNFLVDAQGNFLLDSDQQRIPVSPQGSMARILQGLASGTYAALPFGAKIEWLQALVGGDAVFKNAWDYYDAQIVRAILFQTLSTMEGAHMARAASDNHTDIGGFLFQYVKRLLEWMVRNDILKPLVRANEADPYAADLTPIVSLSDTEQSNFAEESGAVATLMTAGFLSPSQYPELDARLGLPERDAAELEALSERATQPPMQDGGNTNDTQGNGNDAGGGANKDSKNG